MDATQFSESDYITADIVKASKTKTAQILGDAKVEETEYGMKIEFPINIDGKDKKYRPNKDTIKNLIGSWKADTKGWIGKEIRFHTVNMKGKEILIGVAKELEVQTVK